MDNNNERYILLINAVDKILAKLDAGSAFLTDLVDNINQLGIGNEKDIQYQQDYHSIANQIMRDSEDISRTCEQYLTKMNYIEEKVSESSQEIEEVILSADQLNKNNTENSSKIFALEKLSDQIKSMGESVINISKQTNLIAFNVAIEVSHTEDEGKGFTVLAEEIRCLADSSASSAEDINSLINKFQNNIKKVIKEIHKTGEIISAEIKKVKKSIVTFNTIHEKLNSLFHAGGKIKNISRDVLAGSRDVKNGSEWTFSIKTQINSKKNQLFNLIKKQLQSYSDTILFGEYIKLNIGEVTEKEVIDNINHFMDMCLLIKSKSEEIERIAEYIFYHLNILGTSCNQFKSGVTVVLKRISEINAIAKKEEEQIKGLQDILRTDFTEFNNIADNVQKNLLKNSESLNDFHKLNTGSWNIAHIVDSLINHTTMTKMLGFNVALEAARLDEFCADYDDLIKDMRKLSEQSGHAASDIKKIMHQIDYLIFQILTGINETIVSSGQIVNNVKRIIKNLVCIGKNIDLSYDSIIEICIYSGTIWKGIEEAEKELKKIESQRENFEHKNASIKMIQQNIHSNLDEIIEPINYLDNYIKNETNSINQNLLNNEQC